MKHVADWTTKATHIPYTHSQMRRQSRDLLKFVNRFVDLEKANDKAPWDLSWRLLRKKGCRSDKSEHKFCHHRKHRRWFTSRVCLSPLLFIIVMDVLASEVGTHPQWGLLFADDVPLCAESSVEVEEELEK